MDCSSLAHPGAADAAAIAIADERAELAMLDCLDMDDPAVLSDFLLGEGEEFSDAVDVVALDLPPLDAREGAAEHAEQHEQAVAAEPLALEVYPIEPLPVEASDTSSVVMEASSICCDLSIGGGDDMSICSAASGVKRPRRRSLTHANPPPPSSKPRQLHRQQQNHQHRPHPRLHRAASSPVDGAASTGVPQYEDVRQDMLTKLAASMKRSEMSRGAVMRHRQSGPASASSVVVVSTPATPTTTPTTIQRRAVSIPASSTVTVTTSAVTPSSAGRGNGSGGGAVPQFQSMIGLSGFLTGQRSTLTSGLEQSRRRLRAYMSHSHRLNSM